MTSQEFSIEFDILYNNISSNQAPGLTEYEKSVFLTQAQEALVLDLYKGTAGDSFETTEEVTRYLSSLVATKADLVIATENNNYYVDLTSVNDVWFITYQSAEINFNGPRDVLVVPAKQDSLYKDLQNPFKGPNHNRILSLSEGNRITLYSKYPINTFYFKYLKRLTPIILEDLSDGLTIENESEQTDCLLPESLHKQILLRAVQMAKAVWQS